MKGIEYRAGNFDDVDSVAQLARDVYQGGTVTWHARMSGAIVRENSRFLVACADAL